MDIDSLAQYSLSRLIELHLFEFVVSGRSLLLYLLLSSAVTIKKELNRRPYSDSLSPSPKSRAISCSAADAGLLILPNFDSTNNI